MSAGGRPCRYGFFWGRWSRFFVFMVWPFASQLAGIVGTWEDIGVIFSWVDRSIWVIGVIVWWISNVIKES